MAIQLGVVGDACWRRAASAFWFGWPEQLEPPTGQREFVPPKALRLVPIFARQFPPGDQNLSCRKAGIHRIRGDPQRHGSCSEPAINDTKWKPVAMPHLTAQSVTTDGLAAVSWLKAKLHLAEPDPAVALAANEPISWQEVHRQDTSRLVRWYDPGHGMRVQERAGASVPETPLDTSELIWVRRNAALIYLLRTGQWQPVPSSPPDCWVERFATGSSGVTVAVARKILSTAFEAVPPVASAPITEPLSANEREWAKQNSTTVRELYNGKLRGIPKHPSRAWVTAFQSAVGGTTAEIAAILAVIVNVAHHSGSPMIAAE
jgi:hypothetical protein